MAKLIDAIHILCGSKITFVQLQKAEQLLNSFVDEFELHYGESNMVFNIHLLKHLANCVRLIGPLPCYSNYHFEDHIGRLVALHKGSTDVATQISEKYLLEKQLFYYIDKSSMVREFYDEIDSRYRFSVCRKVAGSLMIGNGNKQGLSGDDVNLIIRALNIPADTQFETYDAMLLNGNIFYESQRNSLKKKTHDSFIYNTDSKHFAIIDCIIVCNENLLILVNEQFEQILDSPNICEFSIPLKELNISHKNIWKSIDIGPKFALIKCNGTIFCSKFPNMYESN